METHRPGTQVPVTTGGAPATHVTHVTEKQQPVQLGGKGRLEGKDVSEGAEQMLHEVKKKGEQVYHAACDACHNWRHYPKLLTMALLLASFLLGAGSLAAVKKVGLIGSGGSYVASHWDRNTADAHHALDVILDHLQHPELYESTKQGKGMVQKARGHLSDFLEGILPSSWGRKTARGYGRKDMERDVKGYMGGDKGYTEEMYEKMGDLSYGLKHGMEQAKDVGYGLGSKMSEMAESVKSKLTPSGERGRMIDIDHEGEEDGYFAKLKRGVGLGEDHKRRRGYGTEDEDEMELATKKLRRVVRQADREL